MALITRVSRLFQADFHAVLDRIEEPEVLLRQAVREMEEELAGRGTGRFTKELGARTVKSSVSDGVELLNKKEKAQIRPKNSRA